LEALIVQMAQENSGWGYDRIVGAFANLGYEVSDQTVRNVLKRMASHRHQTKPEHELEGIHSRSRIKNDPPLELGSPVPGAKGISQQLFLCQTLRRSSRGLHPVALLVFPPVLRPQYNHIICPLP
jgi:hypothetical protein